MGSDIEQRKSDHIEICLSDRVEQNRSSFDDYFFEHNALPEIDFDAIDTSVEFLGFKLNAPILISSMTGGVENAVEINQRLAKVAESKRIAFALGSQRAQLEDASRNDSFDVRSCISSVPLIGNIGAVNLNYGLGVPEVQKAIDLVQADAVFLHLNALQEVAQEGGDTRFGGLEKKIAHIVKSVSVPVLVKEVGNGISGDVARRLSLLGIEYIDVSGKGGTSWVYVESQRATDPMKKRLGDVFGDWGIDTMSALNSCKNVDSLKLIAGGGLRNGLDIAKSIAAGAQIATMARPFLKAAVLSEDAIENVIDQLVFELKVAMFCVGARTIPELTGKKLMQKNG